MNLNRSLSLASVLIVGGTLFATAVAAAENLELLKSRGELIVDDAFDREELGEPWTTNSGRAKKAGDLTPQAQIVEGVLQIRRSEKAGHGASVRRPVEFTDALIQIQFSLIDEESGFALNLNDTMWGKQQTPKRYGHLGRVQVTTDKVLIEDQKSPGNDTAFRKLQQSGVEKEQLKEWKDQHTRVQIDTETAPNRWHVLVILLQGDTARVMLDGKACGQFTGAGFAHPTKRLIAFAVPKAVDIEELKIWKLR